MTKTSKTVAALFFTALAVGTLTACGSSASGPAEPNPAAVVVVNEGWSDGSDTGGTGAISSKQFTREYEGGRERLCTIYRVKGWDQQMIDCVWADEAILETKPR